MGVPGGVRWRLTGLIGGSGTAPEAPAGPEKTRFLLDGFRAASTSNEDAQGAITLVPVAPLHP